MIDTILLVSFSGSNPDIWFKHEPESFDTIRPRCLSDAVQTAKIAIQLLNDTAKVGKQLKAWALSWLFDCVCHPCLVELGGWQFEVFSLDPLWDLR